MFLGGVFHSHSFAMNRKRTLTIKGHQMVMTPMTPRNSIAFCWRQWMVKHI